VFVEEGDDSLFPESFFGNAMYQIYKDIDAICIYYKARLGLWMKER
jgi:hypothetical protein